MKSFVILSSNLHRRKVPQMELYCLYFDDRVIYKNQDAITNVTNPSNMEMKEYKNLVRSKSIVLKTLFAILELLHLRRKEQNDEVPFQ